MVVFRWEMNQEPMKLCILDRNQESNLFEEVVPVSYQE